MALGAIIKSAGGALVKQQGKKLAADKLMGRGRKKTRGGKQQTPDQKKQVAQNIMSSRAGGSVTPQVVSSTPFDSVSPSSSGAPSGGSGGSLEIINDISIAVSEIAKTMQGSLVLKEKAQRKSRIAAEKEKRAAKEAATEKPKKKEKDGGGMPQFKVPGAGLLSGIFGFITKFLYGVVIMKLIEFAPQFKKLLGVFKIASKLFNIITDAGGIILNGLATFIDFGYKLVDGAERIVGKIFGEEGAEKFKTFMENLKNLVNAFLVWKIIGKKIFTAIITRLKGAFNLVKNFLKRGAKLFAKLFPNLAKGAGNIFQAGKGLASKGLAKVGGFAAKIFGKAAGVIAPAFKAAKPFASKFFSKVPVVGPLVVGIVSLLSGEPAGQAIFKAMGAALGGVAGSFIPIPILGTLIGETIGVFVGDLLYELIMGGGVEAAGQKLKDTFKTFIEPVFNFFKDGIGRFFSNFPMIDIPAKFGIQTALGKLFPFMANSKGLVTSFPNLSLFIPGPGSIELIKHMGASFMPGIFGDKSESKKEEAKISDNQNNKNGKNASEVAKETTYESGEGNAVIIPVPIPETKQVAIKNKRGRTVGYKTVVIDDSELALYGGK